MTILVDGVEKKLVARDKNSLEFTHDLLGNYDAYTVDEAGNIVMDLEAFEWWDNEIDMLNEIVELEKKLSDEKKVAYESEDFASNDLDTETSNRLSYLKSI